MSKKCNWLEKYSFSFEIVSESGNLDADIIIIGLPWLSLPQT